MIDKSVYRNKKRGPDGNRYEYGPYWIQYYQDGIKKRESTEVYSYAEALAKLNERRRQASKGMLIETSHKKLTVNDLLFNLCLDYKTNGRKSAKLTKGRCTNHLLPILGGYRATQLTSTAIRNYIKVRQEEEASNASINRELAALKRAYHLAVQEGKISFIPYIPMLQESNIRKGFFDEAKFRSVLKHLPGPVRPVAMFAFCTGWRWRSEIVPLTWAHVDTIEGVIRLDPGMAKNKEGRVFPYAQLPELKTLIDVQLALHKKLAKSGKITPWVFVWDDGRPIKDFRKSWADACTKAGCPGMLMHDFRRTAVRNLERACVPRSVAMALTGHKTEHVYRRYDIVDEGDLREGVKALTGRILGRISGFSAKVKKSQKC